jgi:ligand-binding sensor domain-containing protein
MLDKKNNIWLGGQDGLWMYDGKIFKSYTLNFTGYVYEDRKGNIWYTSDTPKSRSMGLFMLSKKNLQLDNPIAIEMVAPKGQIYGIIEDRKGNIWFGKSDGIGRYDGKGFEYFR